MTAPGCGGVDEIREQLARWLCERVVARDRVVTALWPDLPEPVRAGWLEWADALLAGPLAPLLALRQRVEVVAKELEDHAVHATVEGSHERGEERARWAGKAAAYLTSRDYVHRALDGTP